MPVLDSITIFLLLDQFQKSTTYFLKTFYVLIQSLSQKKLPEIFPLRRTIETKTACLGTFDSERQRKHVFQDIFLACPFCSGMPKFVIDFCNSEDRCSCNGFVLGHLGGGGRYCSDFVIGILL